MNFYAFTCKTNEIIITLKLYRIYIKYLKQSVDYNVSISATNL